MTGGPFGAKVREGRIIFPIRTTDLGPATLAPLLPSSRCCQIPWWSRTRDPFRGEVYADLDALLVSLPPELKALPDSCLGGSPIPGVEYGLEVGAPRDIRPWIASPFWQQITHLEMRDESGLESLRDLDLGKIESLHFTSFLEKSIKLPPVVLPALRRVRCPGQFLSLERLLAGSSSITELHLTGGLKAKAKAALASDRLAGLHHLGLEVMASEKELLSVFDGAQWPALRSLVLNGNRLTPAACAEVRALPSYRSLNCLRVGGADMTARAVELLLEPTPSSIVTLEVANSLTYAGLSKADPNVAILRVLARSSNLPVRNLILGSARDVSAIQQFVRAQPLRSLERVYLRHRILPGRSIASVADVVSGGVASVDPLDVTACAAWLPLVEQGVEVFVFA